MHNFSHFQSCMVTVKSLNRSKLHQHLSYGTTLFLELLNIMLTCVNYTRWDSTIKSFCILSSVNVSVNIKVNICSDEAMILPGRLKECRWLRLRTINSSQAVVICQCDISIVKVRRCRCCRMHSSHSRGLSRAAALCHRLRPRLLFRFWLLWSDFARSRLRASTLGLEVTLVWLLGMFV